MLGTQVINKKFQYMHGVEYTVHRFRDLLHTLTSVRYCYEIFPSEVDTFIENITLDV